MKQTINTDNYIFKYAFTGALLFVAAIVYVTANFNSIQMLELSYTLVASVLSISAVTLLYRAIKNDNARIKKA